MSKLYYTDPLAAAYMAREFGVLIGDWDNEKGVFFTRVAWLAFPLGMVTEAKLYIHPDSYHIFEPQVGDMVVFPGDDETDDASRVNCDSTWMEEIEGIQIIQRNNKPFFWPERKKSLAITGDDLRESLAITADDLRKSLIEKPIKGYWEK